MNSTALSISKKRETWKCFLLSVILVFLGISVNYAQEAQKVSKDLENLVTRGSTAWNLKFKPGIGLKAVNLFSTHKSSFGLGNNDQMINYQTHTDKLGYTHYRFKQYHKGIPFETADVIVSEKGGEVKGLVGNYIGKLNLPKDPQISESNALQKALNYMNASVYAWQIPSMEDFIKTRDNDPSASFYPKGELCYFRIEESTQSSKIRLAYKFKIQAMNPYEGKRIYVDAMSGEILGAVSTTYHDSDGTAFTRYSGVRQIKTTHHYFPLLWDYYSLKETGRGGGIETFDMNQSENYATAIPFQDDNNMWAVLTDPNDDVALDAHWGTEKTYDYYLNVHGRNSYNNAGAKLVSYVHFGVKYNNAYWDDGLQGMTYGDGDGVVFSPLTCLDVVGHEITHAVVSSVPALDYQNESGALNESFADIFGTAVEFYGKGGNWLIGEDIKPGGGSLRSMANPKSCGQPDTYRGQNWRATVANPVEGNDYGGVHRNCGVPNYWFYLLVNGGSGTNDAVDGTRDKYNVTGIGFDKAIEIAYLTLTTKMTANSTFMDARNGSIEVVKAKYPGDCTDEYKAVVNAWYAVNVGDPLIQIKEYKMEKPSCDEDNGKLWIDVRGVDPGPAEYEWSNGETTQEITDLAPETYSVTITDPDNGCTVDTTFVLEEDINFTEYIIGTDVTTCGGDDGTATVYVNNAIGVPTIAWSTGETTEKIENLGKGTYTVTVTDPETKCEVEDEIEIKEPEIDVFVSGGGTRTICDDEEPPTFTLTAMVLPNCDVCTYVWSTGETSKSIDVTAPGNYSATATNADGCSGEDGTQVNIIYRNCDDPDDPSWDIPIVSPLDPNEIIGPAGYGPARFVAKSADQPYTILYENDPDFATAPAIKVMVDEPFDPKADMSSFRLGDFGFGNFAFSVPPNTTYYTTRLDLVDSLGVFVDVTAGIDVNNHKGFWILQSIDPATGVEVTNPNLGFLPVNDSITHTGEGFVSFTQKAATGTISGDTLKALGIIIFDQNEAILTNIWANTIDALAPTSQVNALPAETDSSWIKIDITGTDDAAGSGLQNYALYYSESGNPFQLYGEFKPTDTIIFYGIAGEKYDFFSIAKDNVGNTEAMKSIAEASIEMIKYMPEITGSMTYDNSISTPMNDILLTLRKSNGMMVDTNRTTPAGMYTLRPFAPGKYTIAANITKPWGGVNATDALLALKHYAEITPLSGNKLIAADVNASGLVNAIDALLIARRFTQLISGFSAGNWYYTNDTIDFADSIVNYDIKAICYGDADGSYIPLQTKHEPTVRLFTEEALPINPGNEVEVPVRMYKTQSISAISLVVYYPGDLLEITGVRANTEKEGTMVYALAGNELRIAWYSLNPVRIVDNGVVLYLRVKAKSLNSTMIAAFSLGADCSIADPAAKELSSVQLYIPKVKIEVPMDYFLLSNHPNPFKTTTTLEYGLPERGRVSLSVYNAMGSLVTELVEGTQEKGRYKVDFDGSKLPAGVYYARFTVEGESGQFVDAAPMVLIR